MSASAEPLPGAPFPIPPSLLGRLRPLPGASPPLHMPGGCRHDARTQMSKRFLKGPHPHLFPGHLSSAIYLESGGCPWPGPQTAVRRCGCTVLPVFKAVARHSPQAATGHAGMQPSLPTRVHPTPTLGPVPEPPAALDALCQAR